MVHKEIKFGTSATIDIYGDAKVVTIIMKRGSTKKYEHTIHKYPTGFEWWFPSCTSRESIPYMFCKTDVEKEVLFRERIRRNFEIASDYAKTFVREDEGQELKDAERRKIEEENNTDIETYLSTFVQNEPKKEIVAVSVKQE